MPKPAGHLVLREAGRTELGPSVVHPVALHDAALIWAGDSGRSDRARSRRRGQLESSPVPATVGDERPVSGSPNQRVASPPRRALATAGSLVQLQISSEAGISTGAPAKLLHQLLRSGNDLRKHRAARTRYNLATGPCRRDR